MKHIHCFVILAGLLAAAVCANEEEKKDWVRVTGQVDGTKATVVWMMKKPPQDGFEGMVIKRRVASQDGSDWMTVNKTPIYPSAVVDSDLAIATSSAVELDRLKKKLSERILASEAYYDAHPEGSDIEDIYTQKLILKGLLKKGEPVEEREFWALSMAASIDPDQAVFCGAGVIDTGLKPDIKYIYGAFPKFKDEALPEHPVHIWNPDYDSNDSRLELTITEVKPGDNSLTIEYSMDPTVMKDVEVDAVAVYRAEAWKGELEFAKVGRGSIRLRNDEAKGGYWDSKADPKKEYLYRFVPQTLLGKDHKRATVFHYQPDVKIEPPKPKPDPKPEFTPPGQVKCYGLGNGKIRIEWEFWVPAGASLKGFRVLRREDNAIKREVLTPDLLPPDSREYIPEKEMTIGQAYDYFVTAVLADGREAMSKEGYWLQTKPLAIPVVQNFQANRIVKNGRVYLRLTWDHPKDEGLENVDEYCIFTNYGRPNDGLSQLGNVYDFTGTQYDLFIGFRDVRDYKLGVAVQRKVTKEIGEIVSLTVPGVRGPYVPKPSGIWCKADSQHKTYALVTWEMPEDCPPLSGFRIISYGSGEHDMEKHIDADVDQIAGDKRSFRIGPLTPMTTHFIKLIVVDKDGLESNPSDSTSYYYDPLGPQAIKSPLTDLKGVFKDNAEGPDAIELSWGLAEQEDDLLGHFKITASPDDAITVAMPQETPERKLNVTVADEFSGNVTLTVQVFNFMELGCDSQSVDIAIPNRIETVEAVTVPKPIEPVKAATQQSLSRKQIILICVAVSLVLFILLLFIVKRNPRND